MRTRATTSIALLLLCALTANVAAAAVPEVIGFQGKLAEADGTAVTGTATVTFSLFADATGGTAIWTETQDVTCSDGGVFSCLLGSVTPFTAGMFDGSDLYLEITHDGETFDPRFRLATAPFAQHAASADTAAQADTATTLGTVTEGDVTTLQSEVAGNGTDILANTTALGALNDGNDTTTPVGWDDIASKPATFPADAHDHDAIYYTETEVDAIVLAIEAALNDGDNTTTPVGWTDLAGVPAGFADDIDDDTQLTEAQVENYVTNGALDLDAGTTIGTNTISVDGHLHSSLAASDGNPADAVVVDADGKVGIGIAAPGRLLEVGGSDNLKIGLSYWVNTIDPDIDAILPGSTGGSLIEGGANGHVVVALRDNDFQDSFSVVSGGGDYMTDSTYDTVVLSAEAGGYVGIGTGEPNTALDVNGGVRIGGTDLPTDFWGGPAKLALPNRGYIGDQGSHGTTWSWNTYRRQDNTYPVLGNLGGRTDSSIISMCNSGIFFSTSDVDDTASPPARMMITSGGNVGIGTTTPTSQLEVAGTVKATAFVGDGSGLTGITSGTGGIANTGSTTIGADTDNNGTGEISLQTRNTSRLIVQNDGDVLIGKTGQTGTGRLEVDATETGLWVTTSGSTGTTAGVYAYASSGGGPTFGLYGRSDSGDGTGVKGSAMNGSGTTYGVYGETASASGYGVYGTATPTSGATTGVAGTVASGTAGSSAVLGNATAVIGSAVGVRAVNASASGYALFADNTAGGNAAGFHGDVLVNGNGTVNGSLHLHGELDMHAHDITDVDDLFAVTITAPLKLFVVPHPTDPTKEIHYVCMEGPQADAYCRGSATLTNGEVTVVLPEHFALVANTAGLTVNVTPTAADCNGLAVVAKSNAQFTVRELNGGTSDATFDWMVCAERTGFENHQVIVDKR